MPSCQRSALETITFGARPNRDTLLIFSLNPFISENHAVITSSTLIPALIFSCCFCVRSSMPYSFFFFQCLKKYEGSILYFGRLSVNYRVYSFLHSENAQSAEYLRFNLVMKFNKQFSAYIETQRNAVPGLSNVEFKRLKKLLKHCPLHQSGSPASPLQCPPSCSVCDQTFFPLLMKEVEEVLGCFNDRVRRLLQMHLASGVHKYMLRLRFGPHARNHQNMMLEGQKLVSYVYMNALAIRKILKKYDKVHLSRRGRAFKSRLQTLHAELLQSPWLVELIALHLNLKEKDAASSEILAKCGYNFECSKPTISCILSDSVTVEIDLTCSICLEMVFDPVSLGCGHIFCNSCACSAASIATVAGLRSADQSSKCPLCRQARVYENAVHLTELGTLVRTRCKDYWEIRLQRERLERLEQAKKHWNEQCRAALGI